MSSKSSTYNNTDLFWLSLGLSLIATGLISFKKLEKQFLNTTSEKVATLDEVSNLVKVKNQSDLAWSKADAGQDLSQDSLVFAGDFSQAKINFLNGSKVILMPGSIMRVFQDQKGKFKLEIKKGQAIKLTPSGQKSFIALKENAITVEEVIKEFPAEEAVDQPVENSPPLRINLVHPPNTIAHAEETTIVFKWDILSEISNQEDHPLIIEIQNPLGEKITTSSPVKSSHKSLQVRPIGRYFWVAKMKDDILDVGEFEVKTLHPPLILAPKNTTLPRDGDLELEWSYGQEEDLDYEIEITQMDKTSTYSVRRDESLFNIKVLPDQPMSWRIRATYIHHKGPWSPFAKLWPEPKVLTQVKKIEEIQVDINEIKDLFKNKIYTDQLPVEKTLEGLSPSTTSLIAFYEGKEMKYQGEDQFKLILKRPGHHKLTWYQLRGQQLKPVTETNIEVILKPLEDKINLPQDIVLEIKDLDKK